jgi:small subunit ribosomal protein S21
LALFKTAGTGDEQDPRSRRVVFLHKGFEFQARRGGEGRVTGVNLRPNESQESLLKRFRKKVTRAGILSTVRRKRWFVSKSELRRIQKKKAIRRIKRRERKQEYGE